MAPKIHCPFKAPSILPPADFSSRKLWPKRSWLTRSSCSATSVARSVLGDSHTILHGLVPTYASSISFARSADVSLWGWETKNYGIPSSPPNLPFGVKPWLSSIFAKMNWPPGWYHRLGIKPRWNPPKGSCIGYHSIIGQFSSHGHFVDGSILGTVDVKQFFFDQGFTDPNCSSSIKPFTISYQTQVLHVGNSCLHFPQKLFNRGFICSET